MSQLPGLSRETRESIAMYHLRVPQTEEELERYYQFRWEMLRKTLHQPKGSERDAWDAMAHHQMVVDEQGNLVGTDREDQKNIAVIFYSSDNAMYAVQYTYPIEAAEGFGTRLSVIASTFEISN